MQPTSIVSLVLAAALGWAGASVFHAAPLQDKKDKTEVAIDDVTHQEPAIGEEHKLLKHAVGHWNCTIHMSAGPGMEEMKSKGKEENMLTDNGRWLMTQFEGDMMGQKFQGFGATTWNNRRKTYTMAWLDSMSEDIMMCDGTWDAKAKKWTWTGEMVGHDGKPAKVKMVTTVKDDDHHMFEMFGSGPDGAEMRHMWIDYERAK